MFYLTGSPGEFTMMSAPVSVLGSAAGSSLEIGTPLPLFKTRVNAHAPISSTLFYSVGKDGQKTAVTNNRFFEAIRPEAGYHACRSLSMLSLCGETSARDCTVHFSKQQMLL